LLPDDLLSGGSIAGSFRREISVSDYADVETQRHSGRHPAVHAQLDREIHGVELIGS
jgi:hypothetical protein